MTPANSMSAFQLPPLDRGLAVFIFPRSSMIWRHVTPSVQKAEAPEELLEECRMEKYQKRQPLKTPRAYPKEPEDRKGRGAGGMPRRARAGPLGTRQPRQGDARHGQGCRREGKGGRGRADLGA